MHSSFTIFSRKTFRLTDFDITSKGRYDITVIWIQFLIQTISVLGILYVFNI